MKLKLLFLLLCFAFIANAQHSVDNLACEYDESPLAVETQRPRFSWQTKSQVRSFRQSAYRIMVADSRDLLLKDKANCWDSKVVKSDRSVLVEYAGDSLRPNTRYYWKVKTYDQRRKASEWSEIKEFVTAFDEADKWNCAQWIALDTLPLSERIVPGVHSPDVNRVLGKRRTATNKLPQFRKEISVGKEVVSAIAYVCGMGHFDFFLNGKKVGDHYLDPAWTDYKQEVNYVAFDITALLEQGKNTLGVMLGNGFYNIPRERYFKLIQSYGYPQLIARVQIRYADGTSEEVVTDTSWRVTESPVVYSSIYGGEDYDARKHLQGWMLSGYDDSAWQMPVVVRNEAQICAQYSTPVKIMEEIPTFKRWKTHKGTWLYDLGQNFSGIVRLKARGESGQTINMHLSEQLEATGNVLNEGVERFGFNLKYTLKGEGLETWQPQFTYYGFRYVEVEGAVPAGEDNPENLPEIESIQGLHTRNSAATRGRFHCSNPLFNKTFELINWGIKSNIASYPTDCPQREKLEWIEQIHLMFGSLQYNYGIERMFTKCMRDMSLSQTKDGIIPDITPTYAVFDWGFYDSPEWGSAFILMPWKFYEAYGDTRLLTTYYDKMKLYVDYLGTKATGHIVSHGLGDWYDLGPNPPGPSQLTSFGVTATAVYYYDIQTLERVARLLGKTDDAEAYKILAAEVKKAFNDKYLNREGGYYDRNSQTANAIALYGDLVEEGYRERVMQSLIADIRVRGNALTAGDIGYNYVLRVLERNGHSDVIYDMNSRYDVPGYGYQLAQGATSLPESWTALRTSSLNHFMLGHLMQWFYEYVGGISREEGSIAYKRIIIAPELVGDLKSAEVAYESPYGLIRSEWRKDGGCFTLTAEVPANTTATVCLPATSMSIVTEGGVPVGKVSGLTDLGMKNGRRCIEVGSGVYSFKVCS